MQLPSHEAVVLVAGAPPIRATKIRYYADPRLAGRVRALYRPVSVPRSSARADWDGIAAGPATAAGAKGTDVTDEGGLKREPELDGPEEVATAPFDEELELDPEHEGDEVQQGGELQRRFTGLAKQAAMDRDDGIPLGGDA